MATIISVTNFTGSKQWSDPSAWVGDTVPTANDLAYVRGIRTTINFSGGYTYWTGSRSIVVSSTTGFPTSGSFYCATDRDQKIKINYNGIASSTTFSNCVVDTSYFAWGTSSITSGFDRLYGGTIPTSTYVLYQPVIEVTGSVIAGETVLEQGGYLKIYNSGSFTFGTNLYVRDATLHVSESGEIKFGLNNIVASSGNTNRIYSENYQMSQILFEGTENRLTTTLTQDVNIDDGKLFVTNTGSFEINDFILVKDPNATLLRTDTGWGTNSNYNLKLTGSYDEAFNVVGFSGSALLVSRMNSIDVPILATSSLNSNVIITDSTRLEPGERVIINNDVYTIQSVSDYDYEVRDYDFTTGTTTLDDWETDTNRSGYFSDFQISSSPVSGSAYALIQHASTTSRFLFIKDIMRQEVKVEAWISNYRNVTSGTSDGGDLGIAIHADPIMDYDFQYSANSSNGIDSYAPFAQTVFVIDRDSNRYNLRQRNTLNDLGLSLTLAGIPTNGLRKYTLDCRKGVIKGYIDDDLVTESFMQEGGYFGRVGVVCYAQNSFTCTRYKVYYPAQQIVLDRAITANPGDKVYETGAQFTHKVGSVVVKQASLVEDPLGHSNLAYGYRGSSDIAGDAIFPYVWNASSNNITNYARTTSTAFWNLINNQTVTDLSSYNFGSSTSVTGSIIVDLGAVRTFTHVTFQEYFRTQTQRFSTTGYIQIRTSNDRTNWTQALAPVNDTRRRTSSDAVRLYELDSPQTARYVQFIRAGVNNESTVENRWSSLGVRNYSDGYKLKLNNVSDFNVGDRIIIAYDGGFYNYMPETSYYTDIINGTTTTGSYVTELKDYYEITSKDSVNKTVTLDRPFVHSFVGKGNRVYKVNKPIRISGQIGQGTWKKGRFVIETGLNNGRYLQIKNAEFTDLSSTYPTNLQSSYSYGSWVYRNYQIHRSDNFEGISIHSCNNSATSYGGIFGYSAGSIFIRDNVFSGWNGRGWFIYAPSYSGALYIAGNHVLFSTLNDVMTNTGITDIYFNYNSFISNTVSNNNNFLIYSNSVGLFQKPQKFQYVRNYVNGGSYCGLRIYNWGNHYSFDMRGNMFEYQDDHIVSNLGFVNQPMKNTVLPKRGNTDNRLTRFNIFGVFSDAYVPSHVARSHQTNWNNWGYNLSMNSYTYFLKYPNEDFYKAYRNIDSNRFAMFGTTFTITNDIVTGSFDLSLNYFHSKGQMANVAGAYTGSLSLLCLKNGQQIQPDLILAKPTEMTPFSTTVNFSGSGEYQIALLQATNSGYVAFGNIYNKLSFTDPQYATIQTNTFDLRQLKDAYPRDYTQFNGYTKDRAGNDNKLRLNGVRLT